MFLHHFTAVLDDWDPRVIDPIAEQRHVITFDNRGVGASGGKVPHTIAAMAADATPFIRALGHDMSTLLGFSLGGGVAQEVTRGQAPGPGPEADPDRHRASRRRWPDQDAADRRRRLHQGCADAPSDPRAVPVLQPQRGRQAAGTEYIARLRERTADRDKPISHQARIAQLLAIREAGLGEPHDLSRITQPTFVANGDNDVMVASSQSRRVWPSGSPTASSMIYPDSGHGGIFQYHEQFVPAVLEFLDADNPILQAGGDKGKVVITIKETR